MKNIKKVHEWIIKKKMDGIPVSVLHAKVRSKESRQAVTEEQLRGCRPPLKTFHVSVPVGP